MDLSILATYFQIYICDITRHFFHNGQIYVLYIDANIFTHHTSSLFTANWKQRQLIKHPKRPWGNPWDERNGQK